MLCTLYKSVKSLITVISDLYSISNINNRDNYRNYEKFACNNHNMQYKHKSISHITIKRKFEETVFTNLHSLQSAIHVTIAFPLIFGETDFMEVGKSMKSMTFVALEKGTLQYISDIVTLHILRCMGM